MHCRIVFAVTLSLVCIFAHEAHAATPDSTAPHPGPGPTATPAGLLAAGDAAIGAGDLQLATSLFQRLAAEFPATPEANEARRALRVIAVRVSSGGLTPAPAVSQQNAAPASTDDDVVIRNEPYSRRTSERLRLSIWEKVDFGVTSFLYGMSVGLSFALSEKDQTSSNVLTPIALGAVAYTLGSVLFLKLADPDRGDLPLALAITSYVPTTTLLVMNAADSHPDGHTIGAATAVAGLLSVPIAVVAARHFDLDPGDTQLVRDAGFWGLVLATAGTLGFGGHTESSWGYSTWHPPSNRTIAAAGLIGLYGGLGLGLLSASATEISLERVRVTTWGGYGGAVVGLLLGAASSSSEREQNTYRGATIGALVGLAITFVSTRGLDGIPDEERTPRTSWRRGLMPAMVQVAGADGTVHPGFGVGGRFF